MLFDYGKLAVDGAFDVPGNGGGRGLAQHASRGGEQEHAQTYEQAEHEQQRQHHQSEQAAGKAQQWMARLAWRKGKESVHEDGHITHVKLPGKRSMAMLQDKSVMGSLILRSDLPVVGIVAVDVRIAGEMESVIVHCRGQEVTAWLNICPHQGRRLDYAPGKFLIDKDQLVCAAHGATFRLADGECIAGPCRGESLHALAVCVNDAGELIFSARE